MIKPSAHQHCIWVFLALFSAISVLGDGLHFLPGVGHGCGGCRPHEESCLSHADHGDDVHSHVATTLHNDQHDDSSGISAARCDEDCPVCQFFTQAKAVPLTVAFETDWRVVEGRIVLVCPRLVDHVAGAYCSRAPPSLG